MSRVIAVEVDGQEIFFETDTPDDYYLEETGVDNVKQKATDAFHSALGTIGALATATANSLRGLDEASVPDEIQLRFGMKLTGEYGAVVAKVSGETQISVTLTYKSKDQSLR